MLCNFVSYIVLNVIILIFLNILNSLRFCQSESHYPGWWGTASQGESCSWTLASYDPLIDEYKAITLLRHDKHTLFLWEWRIQRGVPAAPRFRGVDWGGGGGGGKHIVFAHPNNFGNLKIHYNATTGLKIIVEHYKTTETDIENTRAY